MSAKQFITKLCALRTHSCFLVSKRNAAIAKQMRIRTVLQKTMLFVARTVCSVARHSHRERKAQSSMPYATDALACTYHI